MESELVQELSGRLAVLDEILLKVQPNLEAREEAAEFIIEFLVDSKVHLKQVIEQWEGTRGFKLLLRGLELKVEKIDNLLLMLQKIKE